MTQFKDHFSHSSDDYQKYRPTYPDELFAYLSSLCEYKELAWDVGTGNGQAAIKLADYYESVLGTDPSQNQIENALKHPKVKYDLSRAENSPIKENTVDLITVAQAFHWFDFDNFYAEVIRVAKPKAILAIWTYTLAKIEPEIDSIVEYFYREVVGEYWPDERNHVEALYADIPFPFELIDTPKFEIELEYNAHDLINYLGTWSAVKNYRLDNGTDPIILIRDDLKNAWKNPEENKKVNWPIYLKVGKVESD